MKKWSLWLLFLIGIAGGIYYWSAKKEKTNNRSTQGKDEPVATQAPKPFHRDKTLTIIKRKPLLRVSPSISKKQAKPKLRFVRKDSAFVRALRRNGIRWGKFGDGSLLLGKKVKRKGPRRPGDPPVKQELWRLTPDGQVSRMAAGIAVTEVKIAPKSERMAIVATGRELYLGGPRGEGGFQKLTGQAGYFPTFDSNGERLAYTVQKGLDGIELRIKDFMTGLSRTLHAGSGVSNPYFHPEKPYLLFASSQTGMASLWKIPLSGGKAVQITNRGLQPGGGLPPSFVPTPNQGRLLWAGDWIVFDSGDAFWAVQDNGRGAHAIAKVSPSKFRWLVPGQSVIYILRQGVARTYNLPRINE